MPEPTEAASASRAPRARLLAVALVSLVVPATLLVAATRGSGGEAAEPRTYSDPTGLVEDPAVPGVAEVGSRAPRFVLETADGARHALADSRGRPTIVTFWASWCLPCRDEMPLLQRAADEHRDTLTVLAVGFRNLPRDDAAWLAEHEITIPALQDPDFEVARAYGVRAIPQTFFIDAAGTIRDRVFGITSEDALRPPLEALLAGR